MLHAKLALGLALILTTPAQAQFLWGWPPEPYYPAQQRSYYPAQQRVERPRPQEHRGHRRQHEQQKQVKVAHKQPKRHIEEMQVEKVKRPEKKEVVVHKRPTVHSLQQGISEDDERDSIMERVKSFCTRYPKDKACHPGSLEEEKKD
jgi:hypothetical protein